MGETDRSSPAQAGRPAFGEHSDAGNGESGASRREVLELELHQKASAQSLSQQDLVKGLQIPTVGPQPVLQQQGSQDTGLNNMSQAGQHPRRKPRWNGGSTHAQRLHAWKAGPKTLSQSKLRELKEKSETDRPSLTRSERQKLGKHMKMEAGNKRDLTPGREVPQDRSNKKRKGQQPNPQGHHQPPDPRGNRIHGLPNAPPSSDNPYVQYPFYSPPPHSETTPPPAPTFKPSSIAELPAVPPAVEHAYHNNQPPPDPQTTPSLPPPTTHASSENAAPHCLGCNVNLAEIERTTTFRYPDTCPLCHTPRVYLSEPRPPKAMLHQQIQEDPARLMLQHIEKWNQVCPISQAGSVTEPYVPAAVLSEDRNLGVASGIDHLPTGVQLGHRVAQVANQDSQIERHIGGYSHDGVDEDRKVKRVKLARELKVCKDDDTEWAERERFEDGISNDGYGEGDDDDATVDEEEWEQWEGAYEDDWEASIKSEDEV